MPFVVFVAPPSMEKLRKWKLERSMEQVDDAELKDIIERAREMEDVYGHYFDMVIIYSDPERAYQELLREINLLEREPQWVPAAWLDRIPRNSYFPNWTEQPKLNLNTSFFNTIEEYKKNIRGDVVLQLPLCATSEKNSKYIYHILLQNRSCE